MGFTSIKVRKEDKEAFDRLLHEFALRTDENLSQHELFHRILEHALARKENVFERDTWKGGRSWSTFQFDLEEPTDAAREVDEVVYGLDDR